MSFIDTLGDAAKSVGNFLVSDGIGSTLARTAITGLALNQMMKSMNKSNTPTQDPNGTQVTVSPNVENSIPVIYGRAIANGLIVDARLSSDNKKMYYVYAISEKTGTVMSTSADSVFTFEEIYWNGLKMVLQSDGITSSYLLSEDGVQDNTVSGLIKIYCYKDGSSNPVVPNGYTNASLSPAYSIMPEWTSNHTMSSLVFVIVEVTYSPTNNVTGIGDLQFKVNNTLTQPGDVLYDYMTNTRYGAGIDVSEISV